MLGFEYFFHVSLQHYIFLGLFVFGIGVLSVTIKKNIKHILMGLILMFSGAVVATMTFRYYTKNSEGDVLAIFIIAMIFIESFLGFVLIKDLNEKKPLNQEIDRAQGHISILILSLAFFIVGTFLVKAV